MRLGSVRNYSLMTHGDCYLNTVKAGFEEATELMGIRLES